jgi:hypothetical protein
MEKGQPTAAAADASTQDFDNASDSSQFSIITPPSPPPVSGCSKCSSHDKTHENGSQIAPVESGQGRTLDEERLPARYAKSGLETPEPCIHSLTEQSEYLRSKLLEVDAALERFKRPAAGKSANAKANTSRDDLRTVTSERQTDDQKQTVASLQEECRQLWEKVTHLSSQNRLEDKDCRSSDANDASSSKSPREDLPPTLTPSEPKPDCLKLADRRWSLELLKMATSLLEPDAAMASMAPASPSDGKKKKKGESKFKAPSEMPFPAGLDQFGMPLVEQPPEPCPMPPVELPPEPYMDPFEIGFLQTYPPKKWTDVTRIDVRWWIRTALYVCQVLRLIGVVILVFKAPGMLRELLDFMHPRDRCIGIRIPR